MINTTKLHKFDHFPRASWHLWDALPESSCHSHKFSQNVGKWWTSFVNFVWDCWSEWITKGVFHLQKISENFYWELWEFPFGKRVFHLSLVPFVYKPLSVSSPKSQMPCLTVLLFSRTRLCSSLSRQTNAYYWHVWLWEVWHLHVPVVLGLQW